MSFFERVKEIWGNVAEKTAPAREKIWAVLCKIGGGIKVTFRFCYRFRAIFLTVVTLIGAFIMSAYCKANLPELVGIDLQSDGSFSKYITRDQAVNSCFLLTTLSLGLMLLSKKTLYPWLISLFTFVIPILLIVTNYLAGAI